MGGKFSKCMFTIFPCCDSDGDKEVSRQEMLDALKKAFDQAESAVDFLAKTAQVLNAYLPVLEAAGVDTSRVQKVFGDLSKSLQAAKLGTTVLDNIMEQLGKGGKAGDINGDGTINNEDVREYFTIALKLAQALPLSDANAKQIQIKIQAMIDAIPAAVPPAQMVARA